MTAAAAEYARSGERWRRAAASLRDLGESETASYCLVWAALCDALPAVADRVERVKLVREKLGPSTRYVEAREFLERL